MLDEGFRFSEVVRLVGGEAARIGLEVPAFRSPPRVPGAVRTIRAEGGGPVVAVATAGRPLCDVIADVIEGIVRVNRLTGTPAVRCRRRLAASVHARPGPRLYRLTPPAGSVAGAARVA